MKQQVRPLVAERTLLPPRSPPPPHREPCLHPPGQAATGDRAIGSPGITLLIFSPILCSPRLAQQLLGENGRKQRASFGNCCWSQTHKGGQDVEAESLG